MITLVWRTDVHVADRSPVSRTDDWLATCLDKVRQVGDIARQVGADAVIDGGDFFHVKTPSKNSHKAVRQVAELHQEYPCPVYANVGNHDVSSGDIRNLPKQPLGVLFETGVFQRLYDEHELLIEKGGVSVRVVGVPYHGTSYDMSRFDIARGDEDFLFATAHVLASQTGRAMFEGEDIVSYSDLSPLFPDLWMFGHWHKDQGIDQIPGEGPWPKSVINVGSLTRGSLSQDHLEREPACVVIRADASGYTTERINLKVASAKEVFDIEGRVRRETKAMAMEDSIEKMRSAFAKLTTDGKSLEDIIREVEGLPEKVRERALNLVEESR